MCRAAPTSSPATPVHPGSHPFAVRATPRPKPRRRRRRMRLSRSPSALAGSDCEPRLRRQHPSSCSTHCDGVSDVLSLSSSPHHSSALSTVSACLSMLYVVRTTAYPANARAPCCFGRRAPLYVRHGAQGNLRHTASRHCASRAALLTMSVGAGPTRLPLPNRSPHLRSLLPLFPPMPAFLCCSVARSDTTRSCKVDAPVSELSWIIPPRTSRKHGC